MSPPSIQQRLLIYFVIFVLVASLEVYFGRILFCSCGEFRLWISNIWSKHNSQHLFDPYSFSHLLHGVIFYLLLSRLGLPRESCLIAGFFIEGLWESIENSPLVIERYRTVTMAQGYTGDSVVNSLGDLISCLLGLELARLLGTIRSFLLIVLVELSMLFAIRDCLTFNVIMLLWPQEWIREWQVPPSAEAHQLRFADRQTTSREASTVALEDNGSARRERHPSSQAFTAEFATRST